MLTQVNLQAVRMRLIATILAVAFAGAAAGQDFGGHALFVRTADAGKQTEKKIKSNARERTLIRESASSAIAEIGERGGTSRW